ncbi:MAG TPA: carboxymuconolactone decarboxylase family protein [Motilibacteraceae bacterium]|nr:carboxymuconolactone decarboxylase family protein [Motilibacteraceae bacterium]
MSLPSVALRDLGPVAGGDRPLLLLGASPGDDVPAGWVEAAAALTDRFDLVGWEVEPGTTAGAPDLPHLATAVLAALDGAGRTGPFHCVGDGAAGAVALHLALQAPDRVRTVAVTSSAQTAQTAETGAHAALTGPDLRGRLADVVAPVLAVARSGASPTAVTALRHVAVGVPHGRFAEDESDLAELLAAHALAPAPRDRTVAQVRADGMRMRREVLGDAWVDAAAARVSEFTGEFQALLTQWAWGTVWTRPGLDLRSRSLVTVTALVAGGHHEELAGHLRAARTNGLTWEELREALIHTAVYCSVPSANAAFRIAAAVYADEKSDDA